MIKTSILKAKINRSKIDFKQTFLFEKDKTEEIENKSISSLLLKNDEELVVAYIKSDDYRWFLTNERIIFPNTMENINFSDLTDVEIPKNIIENPDIKLKNVELILHTKNRKQNIYVEEKTWHLFYNVFKFIILNQVPSKIGG